MKNLARIGLFVGLLAALVVLGCESTADVDAAADLNTQPELTADLGPQADLPAAPDGGSGGADATAADAAAGDSKPPSDLPTRADTPRPDDTLPPADVPGGPDLGGPRDVFVDTPGVPDVPVVPDVPSGPDTPVLPDTMPDFVPPDGLGEGACVNPADGLVLSDAGFQATMNTCIQGCIMAASGCTGECLMRETGLSAGCAACFDEIFDCTKRNCMFQCIDSGSASCAACREQNCNAAFEACAGFPPR